MTKIPLSSTSPAHIQWIHSSSHLVTSLLSTLAVALPSTLFLSPSKPSSHSSCKTPFLSFPHFSTLPAARPPPRIWSARPAFRVRCQDASALVPEEKLWMVDGDVSCIGISSIKLGIPRLRVIQTQKKHGILLMQLTKLLGDLHQPLQYTSVGRILLLVWTWELMSLW